MDGRKENHGHKNTTRVGVKNERRSFKKRWKNYLNKIQKSIEENEKDIN